MTGIKDFNYPEFHRVTKGLRDAGHKVVNPVEICAHLPDGSEWQDYMDICIPAIEDCKKIYLLKGWEGSRGAKLELKKAIEMNLEVVQQGDFI
jgi:hypothetical protein